MFIKPLSMQFEIDLDEVRQNTELNRNIYDRFGGAKAPTCTPDLEMVQMVTMNEQLKFLLCFVF